MGSSMLLLLLATLALALFDNVTAIDRVKFDGEYERQAGSADRCQEKIRFDSLEDSVPADRIDVNEEDCTGGSFNFEEEEETVQGEQLTNFLEGQFDDDDATWVTGVATGDITCNGNVAVAQDTRFTFFALEDSAPPFRWSDIYNRSVPIGGSNDRFDPEDNTAYMVTGDGECLYELGSRVEEVAQDAAEEAGDAVDEVEDEVCFPASAKATLESGSTVRMNQLKIGDRVHVGKGVYSDVFMFTHYDAEYTSSNYVRLRTSDNLRITLTTTHYIYANDKLVPASEVKVGDYLLRGDGTKSIVTEVQHKVKEQGLYNPQTIHGSIVVDGVTCSTYTKAVEPKLAHALLSPLRAIYRLFSGGFAGPIKTEL